MSYNPNAERGLIWVMKRHFSNLKSCVLSPRKYCFAVLLLLNACDVEPAKFIASSAGEDGSINDRGEFETQVMSLSGVTALSYTAAFADRVGIRDKVNKSELTPGIHAIELKVERNEAYFTSPYSCFLRLYMDANLGVEFPDSLGKGALRLLSEINFFVRMNGRGASLSSEDNLHLEELRSSFRGKAQIVLKDKGEEIRFRESASYIEYYEGILSDVNYAKILINCSSFSRLSASSTNSSAELWLKAVGTREVTSFSPEIDQDLFLRIVFPPEFLESAIGIMQEAHESNIRVTR